MIEQWTEKGLGNCKSYDLDFYVNKQTYCSNIILFSSLVQFSSLYNTDTTNELTSDLVAPF